MSKFDFDDIVCAIAGLPESRLGLKAWIVGITSPESRRGSYYEQFPPGEIYTVEFEDGSSVDVHESGLKYYAED
ncbi:hypothetical protein BGP89_14335 [Luteimonas sp. JM171]|uniref:hypothetical protein n=1 Tax=Luteimonas sp. JM171 TaxID=1896164 RepID=UPI000BA356B8|nr:hypothetical protein [Luteimonas sp. JM171]